MGNSNDLQILRQVLSGRSIPGKPEHFESSESEALFDDLTSIRGILSGFAQGNVDNDISVRGAYASYLKTLQANLRHLTWQAQQVAKGDFSQRVDFMGSFSAAFNYMIERFTEMVDTLKEREERLLKLTAGLQSNKERWNLAIQCSRDGIWDVDILNKTGWYSESFMQMMHYTADDLPKDLRWDLLVHPDDQDQADMLRNILQTSDNIVPFSLEFRMRNHAGEYPWIRLRGMPVHADSNDDDTNELNDYGIGIRLEGSGMFQPPMVAPQDSNHTPHDHKRHRLIAVASDISAQKEIEHSLTHRAMHDNLTELPNRYLLQDRLLQYVARAKRGGDPFVVVTLDLDNFKGVNDTFGHAAGDTILIEFAKRLQIGLRNTDTASRTGGDEFILVFPCSAGTEEATTKHVMTRFFGNLGSSVDLDGTPYTIHSSAGAAFFPQHASDLTALLARSDAALYRAKRNGKDQYAIWQPEDDNAVCKL